MDQFTFTLAQNEEEILLVEASVGEMGFAKGAQYQNICNRVVGTEIEIEGIVYVVELCPSEVGPQLRRQYLNQPKGEWLRIAMEAISDSNGNLWLFGVVYDNGRRLYGHDGDPDRGWSGEHRFVFCLRKKK